MSSYTIVFTASISPWMNGTTVSLNKDDTVSSFHMAANASEKNHYKTVNICSLSLECWYRVLDKLDHYVSAKNLNSYYEAVFADLMAEDSFMFSAVLFDQDRWYEIDTIEDLQQAEKLQC